MKLDLKKFCLLLSQAKEPPKSDEYVNRYLLDHVLTPALSGAGVLIGDIDFSRFCEEDIDFLEEHYDCLEEAQRDILRLGEQVEKIPPTAGRVRAFC